MEGIFDVVMMTGVLLALFIASLTDLQRREVPDWISYGLLFFVIATRVLQSLLTQAFEPILVTLFVLFLFFIFGNVMYFAKQWGGGDAKLIMPLGAAFAIRPVYFQSSMVAAPVIVLVNILIVGTIYGLAYALFLAIKNRKAFAQKFIEMNRNKTIRHVKLAVLAFVVGLLFIGWLYNPQVVRLGNLQIMGIAVFFLLTPYLFLTVKAVELACMYKKISPDKLTEGDWVDKEVRKGTKVIYKVNPYGITGKEIIALRKANIKEVIVKEGIPFIPSFFLGTIVTLVNGSIIFISFV